MDFTALQAKWATLSGTTQQKLDAINTLTVPSANTPVPILQVMTYLRENGLWLPIKAAAAAGTSVGAQAAVDYNEDPRAQTLDMSLSLVQQMLGDLVSKGLLSQDQANAILAMGTPQILWTQANGYGPIGLGYLNNAGLS